jgi:tetratricopeptide (TPR) repeat protein
LAAAEQALVRNPHNLMAVLQRSLALEGLGRTEEALSDMETVTAILPDNSKLLYQGLMLVNLNRLGEALDCLNRVLQHDPKYQNAWITKGIVLARLSRFEEAAQAFEQCLQLAPQNTVALANYAWALNQQGEWQKALELLNRALELEPAGKAMLWNNHGWALVELGRDEEAINSFTKALEDDPNNALIWANLGELYRGNDLDAEALAFYTKALERDPDNAFALFGLGTSLRRLCRVAESLEYLSKATEITPKYAPGWANRGAALELLGSFEEAAVSYQRAVELGDRQATTFFNYAQTLSVLNRWSDLYPVLDQALLLTGGVSLEKIDPIIKNLLAGSDNQPNLLERAARLMEVFGKHERDYPLSLGIMRSVPLLVSDQISDKGAEVWVRTWREVASGSGDFEMALRLIDAALAYRKSKDQRALLELPTEERSLLESLLNPVADPCLRGKAIV